MPDKTLIYVGDEAAGLYRKEAGDANWESLLNGLPPSPQVRAIVFHPSDANVVLVGTQRGVYKSSDRGDTFKRTNLPEGRVVWSFKFNPHNPDVIFLGTEGSEVYRSEDGGDNWQYWSVIENPDAYQMSFSTRILGIAIDENNADNMYAALEVGGAASSADGGKNWKIANKNFGSDVNLLDLHGVAIGGAGSGSVFISNRTGVWRSEDRGENWRNVQFENFSDIRYSRGVEVAPNNPDTLYACVGLDFGSEQGGVLRSTDGGDTWHRFDKGVAPGSTTFGIAVNDRDPEQVYFCTRRGQVFGTHDGGATWDEHALPETAKSVKAVACTSV